MTPSSANGSRTPLTIASIDIGTNTVLLLIARVDPAGLIIPLVSEQRMPRLGRGVDAHRRLHPESMERVAVVLEEYAPMIARHRPDAVALFGTSAVRDALNRDELAALIARRTGFRLEVLSGAEEARWTYRGAVSGMPGIREATVIDIGGGSTEVTSGTASDLASAVSLDIGSVRLTERILKHDPPTAEERKSARTWVQDLLHRVDPPAGSRLVAVAGTATTLALLARQRRTFSLEAVSGFILSVETVSSLTALLERSSSAHIRSMAEYLEGRHDIITAGAMILESFMRMFGFTQVTVSERGVRYGVAVRAAEEVWASSLR